MTGSLFSLAKLGAVSTKALLKLAAELDAPPRPNLLAGKMVALLFMNPSLRTLASMQTAVAQLGGTSQVIQPGAGSWKLEFTDGAVMEGEAVEHIREAIPVLCQYADILGVRCFAEGSDIHSDLQEERMAKIESLCSLPFINLESAANHPCQALADWKTMDESEIPAAGGNFVLSWAYHPKPLPYAVPNSALQMALMRGMNVTVLRPDGFDLPEPLMNEAQALASQSGAELRTTSNRAEAMEGAHVLYAKSWCHPQMYGNPIAEAEIRSSYRNWIVSEDWFAPSAPSAKFMHCLPVRRNVKVTDEILDGPRSLVLHQAANRLSVQRAVLAQIAQGGFSR